MPDAESGAVAGLILIASLAAVVGVSAWAFLMGPIGRAIARWIEARTPNAHGQLMADLAEVESRVTRLERLLREATPARSRRWPRAETD
jgi:hypothetical protein